MNSDRFTRTLAARGITLDPAELDRVYNGEISRLLTTGNPKTAKGEKQGYLTAILHLAPAWTSGIQTCPKATDGCSTACLFTAGRGGFDAKIPAARKRRTYWYFTRRAEFMDRLAREIHNHCWRAVSHGLIPAVRLNGTSDIPFERVPYSLGGYQNIFEAFPSLQFYDYTKRTDRVNLPANYHLTFSAADGNDDDVNAALADGMNVAMVFRSRRIMNESNSLRSAGIRMRRMVFPEFCETPAGTRILVDGDKSDLRFLDPPNAIVGLRAKGLAVNDQTGFVRDLP